MILIKYLSQFIVWLRLYRPIQIYFQCFSQLSYKCLQVRRYPLGICKVSITNGGFKTYWGKKSEIVYHNGLRTVLIEFKHSVVMINLHNSGINNSGTHEAELRYHHFGKRKIFNSKKWYRDRLDIVCAGSSAGIPATIYKRSKYNPPEFIAINEKYLEDTFDLALKKPVWNENGNVISIQGYQRIDDFVEEITKRETTEL